MPLRVRNMGRFMDIVVPFDQLGVANPGPWTNASPQAGIKGSIVNANFFPAVQEEILAVQDEAGLTRDGSNHAQMLQAIRSGKLTFFVDTGAADALVISPRTSFPNFAAGLSLNVWKNPGVGGNATTTPKLSAGALSMKLVKEDGSALAAGDLPAGCFFTARSDGTSLRVQGLRKSDATPATPITYGAATQGGLAKDGSNNFRLNLDNLPAGTTANPNDRIALQTEESENGLTSGTPFAATLSTLAALFSGTTNSQTLSYLASQGAEARFKQQNNLTDTQYDPNANANYTQVFAGTDLGTFTVPAGYVGIMLAGTAYVQDAGNAAGAGLYMAIWSNANDGTGWIWQESQRAYKPLNQIGNITRTSLLSLDPSKSYSFSCRLLRDTASTNPMIPSGNLIGLAFKF